MMFSKISIMENYVAAIMSVLMKNYNRILFTVVGVEVLQTVAVLNMV